MGGPIRGTNPGSADPAVKFLEMPIEGAWAIQPEPARDDRGYFARVFDVDAFIEHGLATDVVQAGVSFNRHARTLRGLHFQVPPHEENKLVRCSRGAVFDVVVDLRSESPTYLQWHGDELVADEGRMLYVPTGCAHGFVTMVDESVVHYQIDAPYVPAAARGIRWDDPSIGIDWPVEPAVMSERDRSLPELEP